VAVRVAVRVIGIDVGVRVLVAQTTYVGVAVAVLVLVTGIGVGVRVLVAQTT